MKSILFIEDDPEISGKLLKEFQDNNIKVIHCPDRKSAEEAIQVDVTFDAVILDWFFQNPEDSILSKLILKKLKGIHFRPVFIYTNNKSNFDETPKEDFQN